MNRQRRLAQLKRLVAQGSYRTQGELVLALHGAGWEVTQASISRDIKTLGLEKVDGIYVAPAEIKLDVRPDADTSLPWGHIRSLLSAGDTMLVLRTEIATAQQVAAALDTAGWDGVAGTIAGDDTVFLATTSRLASEVVSQRLRACAGLVDRRRN